MQSLNPVVVKEDVRIKALARKINSGTPFPGGLPARLPAAKVTGYRGTEEVVSFTILEGPYIVARDGVFYYGDAGVSLVEIATDIGPLVRRCGCAHRVLGLAREWYRYPGKAVVRPAPDTWCDATAAKHLKPWETERFLIPKGEKPLEWAERYVEMQRRSLAYVRSCFQCPAAGAGECHYAMNSNCTAQSPPDTVFLFETRAGWNQHGGPELFTFDHHNPKGGMVCLNDYTVKFIRTEEELRQLRWK